MDFCKSAFAACVAETATLPFGIGAGYMRQIMFGGLRVNLFPIILEKMPDESFLTRMLAGLVSGGIAMLIASPTDLIKIQVQSGKVFPMLVIFIMMIYLLVSILLEPSIQSVLRNVYKVHGVRGFWVGVYPNIVRNSVINMAELGTYHQYNASITREEEKGWLRHTIIGGGLAGLLACIIGAPVDTYKSLKMNGVLIRPQEFRFEKMYRGFSFNLVRMVGFNVVLFSTLHFLK